MANRKKPLLLQALSVVTLLGGWYISWRSRRGAAAHNSLAYSLRPAPMLAASAALLLADAYAIPAVLRAKQGIGSEELGQISTSLVSWFDRHALSFVGGRSEHYRRVSDKVLVALIALPLALLFDKKVRRHWRRFGPLYAWTHAVTYTIYSFSPLGPAFVDKFRPVVYYADLPEALRSAGNNRNARFSGHTANGACAAFFLVRIFNRYHARQSYVQKRSNYVFAFGAALLLGWLRMKALKHFPSDVLQAVIIGGACGLMIPKLYERPPSASGD
jgi:hypothetical protein